MGVFSLKIQNYPMSIDQTYHLINKITQLSKELLTIEIFQKISHQIDHLSWILATCLRPQFHLDSIALRDKITGRHQIIELDL